MKSICSTSVAFFILFSAFGQNSSNNHKTNPNIDTSRIAIFNLDSEPWLRSWFEHSKAYLLTNADVRAINKIFQLLVISNRIDTNYYHYKRQYVPFIDKSGKRKVWVNCFCTGSYEFKNWKKNIVLVDDGGRCYFNVILNVTDGTYSNLEFNGYG